MFKYPHYVSEFKNPASNVHPISKGVSIQNSAGFFASFKYWDKNKTALFSKTPLPVVT